MTNFNINEATKKQILDRADAFGLELPRKGKVEDLRAALLAGWVIPEDRSEGECPHCGVSLDNGLIHVDDESLKELPGTGLATGSGKSYREIRDMDFAAGEYECMGCGGHFGAIPEFPAAPGTGLKIEKDRPEQNGIKRPSAGGRCRAVWDALDAYLQETGEQPTAKVVKDIAADEGWNPNNASIEFYQWRKFHGITGRQPKVAAPAA